MQSFGAQATNGRPYNCFDNVKFNKLDFQNTKPDCRKKFSGNRAFFVFEIIDYLRLTPIFLRFSTTLSMISCTSFEERVLSPDENSKRTVTL